MKGKMKNEDKSEPRYLGCYETERFCKSMTIDAGGFGNLEPSKL